MRVQACKFRGTSSIARSSSSRLTLTVQEAREQT